MTRSARATESTPPIAAHTPAAPWPGASAEGHDIVVPVVLVVDEAGAVVSAELEASVGRAFDERALETARTWTFHPALADGRPIKAKVRAVVRFIGRPKAGPTREAEATPAATTSASSPPEEVRVSGEKRAEPARSASEVVRERADLAAAPHRTASDMLLTVPGVALTQHSGEGAAAQIYFRGFDAVHGQDIEIWAAGAPVNDVSNIHGQGYADLNFLPYEIVKRIQSQPGTYDPRQGDFAVAGTMRLALGYAEPGVTAKTTLGQFGTRRYFLAYHPKDTPDTTFAAFELYATDGFGPSRAVSRTSAVGQADYRLGEVRARVMASTYATTFESPGVLRLQDIDGRQIDRFGSYDPHQGGDGARSQLVVELRHDDEKHHASLSLAPYVVLRSMRLRQDYTGYLVEPVTGAAGDMAKANAAAAQGNSEQQLNDALTFGMKGSYARQLKLVSPQDTFEAGIFARADSISQSQKKLAIDTGQVTLDEVSAKVFATNVAGYIDAALHPLPRVTARGGVRIDGLAYFAEDDGGQGQGQRRDAQGAHLGKKATVDVLIVPGLSAVGSYGDGFRSPQARSLQQGQTAPFTTVQSYELGMRYRAKHLSASAAVFRTLLSDDLAFNQQTARNERTPPTDRTGFSVEATSQAASWLRASGSVTYTRAAFASGDARYAEGALLPYAPQLIVRTDAAWTPTLGHVGTRTLTGHFGVGGTGIALRPLPYAEFGQNAYLVDVRASVRLKEVQLELATYNLLNLGWFDGQYTFASNFQRGASPSLVPARHVSVGAPRTVMATLSVFL